MVALVIALSAPLSVVSACFNILLVGTTWTLPKGLKTCAASEQLPIFALGGYAELTTVFIGTLLVQGIWLLFGQYVAGTHNQRLLVDLHTFLAGPICWMTHHSVSRVVGWASEKQPGRTPVEELAGPESLYGAEPAAVELGARSADPALLSQPAVPSDSDCRPGQSTGDGGLATSTYLSGYSSTELLANLAWLKLHTVPIQLKFSVGHAWIG